MLKIGLQLASMEKYQDNVWNENQEILYNVVIFSKSG